MILDSISQGEEKDYVLSVVFNGASMIQTDHISFEVSIGKLIMKWFLHAL